MKRMILAPLLYASYIQSCDQAPTHLSIQLPSKTISMNYYYAYYPQPDNTPITPDNKKRKLNDDKFMSNHLGDPEQVSSQISEKIHAYQNEIERFKAKENSPFTLQK